MEKSLFLALQKGLNEKEAELLIEMLDANGDGVLDKQELMADLTHISKKAPTTNLTREEIKEILVQHDIDGDGFLNEAELTKAIALIGSRIPQFKAHHAMAYADDNGDGLISMAELTKLIDYIDKSYKTKSK